MTISCNSFQAHDLLVIFQANKGKTFYQILDETEKKNMVHRNIFYLFPDAFLGAKLDYFSYREKEKRSGFSRAMVYISAIKTQLQCLQAQFVSV